MILGDQKLRYYIKEGIIEVIPEPKEEQYQPASLDLHLAEGLMYPVPNTKEGIIDPTKPITYKERIGMRIEPKEFVIASTLEYIELPCGVAAAVEGRSSLGRLGLFIENAGHIDPGFEGQITLELFNASEHTIELIPGMRICQLVFYSTIGVDTPYRGKYQKQRGPTPSKINLDFID